MSQFETLRDQYFQKVRDQVRGRRVTLVNYATPDMFDAQANQNRSAIASGEFSGIQSWNPDILKTYPYYRENESILKRKRGAGYWIWKPFIILEALKSCREGDFVIYYDSGRYKNAPHNFVSSILPLLDWCENENPLLFSSVHGQFLNRAYCKRDAYILMDCDEERYWNHPQFGASILVMRNCRETVKFVTDWMNYCTDVRIVTDEPNVLKQDNLPGFVENRHDQTILNLLALKRNLPLFNPRGLEPLKRRGNDIFVGRRNMNILSDGLLYRALSPKRRGLKNIAKGKPCNQSSTWPPNQNIDPRIDAQGAVKGFQFFDYGFSTNNDPSPWWQVDLNDLHKIKEIWIFNRPDQWAVRAADMILEASVDQSSWIEVANAGAVERDPKEPFVIQTDSLTARYVRVRIPRKEYLHLDEVEVYVDV